MNRSCVRSFLVLPAALAMVAVSSCKKNHPPTAPLVDGPTLGIPGEALSYTFSSTDPEGTEIEYMVAWGDTSAVVWSPTYASGQQVMRTHSYADSGTYHVKVKARDGQQAESEWSDSIAVSIAFGPGGAPTGVALEAATDSTVKVWWTAPTGGTPDKYYVAFMATDAPTYTDFDTVTTTYVVHDPAGKTGKYKVTAVFGSQTYDAASPPRTTPIATATTTVCELNGAGSAGYGWDRTAGAGSTYSMNYAGNAAYVDFYITDFGVGYAGPYSIASPDVGPSDPGGTVPAGSWRVNGFTNLLLNETDPLPSQSSFNYFNYTELTPDACLVGCHTDDGYYALVKLSNYNTGTGTVSVQSWFQLIKGLRLIQH